LFIDDPEGIVFGTIGSLLLIDCLLLIGLFIIEFDGLVLIDNF
jgi:hypothetical protein